MPNATKNIIQGANYRRPGIPTIIIIISVAILISSGIILLTEISARWSVTIIGGLLFVLVLLLVDDPKPILLATLSMSTILYINITILSTPEARYYHKVIGGLMLDLSDIVLGLLYFLWMRQSFENRGAKITLKFIPLISFILFATWSMLSILNTDNQFLLPASFRMTVYIRQIFLLWYLMNNIRDFKSIKALLYGAVIGIVLQSSIGLIEKLFGHTINIPVLSPKRASAEFGEGGMSWAGGRIQGAVRHPNDLAKLLSLYIPVFLYLGLFFKKDFKFRFVLICAAVLAIIAVILTLSRSGWIGLAISLMGGLFWLAYQYKKMGTFVLTTIIAGIVIIPPVLLTENFISDRIFNANLTYTGAVYGRIPQFKTALNYIANKPILGVGMNMYSKSLRKYEDHALKSRWKGRHVVHNTYLYFAAENGLPALVFLLIFFGSTIYIGLRLSNRERFPPPLNFVAIGLTMGLFSNIIAISYTVVTFEELWSIWIPIGIISAIYLNFKPSSENLINDSPSRS